jgi:hypothetical protein
MFGDEEKRVKDKIEKGYMPFRFFQGKDEECEITILDASLEEGFARPEHNLKGADGKWGNIVPCIRNEANCPICKKEKEGAVVLYLSILSHRGYVSKKTGEKHTYSKMFLCLKRGQYNDFSRIEKAALKKYGTLRGVTLLLHRDNEETSFSTGMPIAPEGEDNLIVDFYDEEALIAEFGHKAIKNKESGKVIRPENDDIQPYDYRRLMPPPDIDEFMEEYGDGPAAGSRRAATDYKDKDEVPMKHEGDATREAGGEGRRKRGHSAEQEQEQKTEGRRARRGAPEPTPEPQGRRARSGGARSGGGDEPDFNK